MNKNYTLLDAVDPHTSPEILKKILEQGKKNNISYATIQNPNCPLNAKIEWLLKTKLIDKKEFYKLYSKNKMNKTNSDNINSKNYESIDDLEL